MKILIPIFAILGLAAMAWSIDLASTPQRLVGESPRIAGSTTASGGAIYAAGRVEGAAEETGILAEIAGRIAKIHVHEGDNVGKGEVLILLDDTSLARQRDLAAAQVAQAEAELTRLVNGAHPQERVEARALVEAATAQRDLAQKTWERIRALQTSSAVTQQNADEQKAAVHAAEAALAAATARMERLDSATREDDVRIAQAKLDVARSQFALAEANLAKTRITAPISGTILKVDAEEGELLGPLQDRAAIVLADTNRLRVRAFVEELDAPRVAPHMQATITADGLPDREFHGTVATVSPAMTQKTLNSDRPDELYDTKVREVWIDLQSGEELVVGLRVDVKIRPQE